MKDNKLYLPEKTEEKKWEKNDRFFLVYALPAIVLLISGFSTGLWWMVSIGAFRPANFDEQFKNVFCEGASKLPGAGLPMAVISSKLAAERIVDYSNK